MDKNSENNAISKPFFMRGLGMLPGWLKSKFLLSGVAFLIWMFFFAEKDISSGFNKRAKYKELMQSEQHLTRKINETKIELSQLKTDAQTIEKYAREKYLMKKENEDLFIVSEDKETK